MFAARKRAKLTQVQACAKVGCSQGTLAELESTALSSGLTAQFADLYGVDALWLADGPGIAPVPAKHGSIRAAPLELTEVEWQLLEDLRALPDEERQSRLEEIRRRADLFRAYAREVIAKIKERKS